MLAQACQQGIGYDIQIFAHNFNLSSGRLTPDVEEINFENPSDGSAEKENRFEVQSLSVSDKISEKEMIKEVCDEITLDVVDSIVTEAHEGERISGLQRQVCVFWNQILS